MNIVVMAKGAGLGAWVDDDFAHARQIVLVKDSGGFEAAANPFASSAGAENSAKLAQFILSKFQDIGAIVAGAFDEDAKANLQEKEISMFIAAKGSVMELAEAARAGSLTRA
ncbi:putative Dinitrogenase iron-molybdenum cofactor biosynthesis protein [uncultured spirochete]|jgi:predicted Fe-Mo cluster-binding NifX family protein|uniref:Putative Dinitrogenase iron-molybdenum cofactor biosynthesis protein n=2 Tax=Spirochaetales TaxID=136 RepID=A0A3P3XHP4_9SPIR|nr:putative Dinitrogenase iron-molybdenum cofactor biosynthesis protein [uncultured spirochete]